MSEAARLSHLFVRVVDLAATRRFYVDLLGLDSCNTGNQGDGGK